MPVVIALLRGVNLAGNRKIKMDALRALCESLQLKDTQTYLQSGNVVFRTASRDLASLARRMESAIEKTFGFHSDVVLRTTAELRDAIARNPFAARRDIDPARLLVTFLASDPGQEARDQAHRIKADPEELRVDGCEAYTYFPNGMGRPKLSWVVVERALKVSGTGRNWNTVTSLLEMAEKIESSQ